MEEVPNGTVTLGSTAQGLCRASQSWLAASWGPSAQAFSWGEKASCLPVGCSGWWEPEGREVSAV